MKPEPKVTRFVDAEEEELYNLTERDDYTPVNLLTPETAAHYQQIAVNTMNEQRVKISLRVREFDLRRLKARAQREGIPYQTLINSILHKAVSGEAG